ncbi:hypothetical protein Nepgr_031831 [Nepenthes gracilis]|uniref:Uncharacterized protein n=1 Tax=Nepenthes gracilis TaxID=150966 RepID=A0AAD3THG7_NEPGR|nr:hypothetical protein Nepgr_031831 [Nepenthes gracilis]
MSHSFSERCMEMEKEMEMDGLKMDCRIFVKGGLINQWLGHVGWENIGSRFICNDETDVAMLMGYPSPYNNHGNQSLKILGFVSYQNQPIPSIIQGHGCQGVRHDPISSVARRSGSLFSRYVRLTPLYPGVTKYNPSRPSSEATASSQLIRKLHPQVATTEIACFEAITSTAISCGLAKYQNYSNTACLEGNTSLFRPHDYGGLIHEFSISGDHPYHKFCYKFTQNVMSAMFIFHKMLLG